MQPCYFVYDDEQLEDALEAFARRYMNHGRATRSDADELKKAVRNVHTSPEFAERGMRRGEGEGEPA